MNAPLRRGRGGVGFRLLTHFLPLDPGSTRPNRPARLIRPRPRPIEPTPAVEDARHLEAADASRISVAARGSIVVGYLALTIRSGAT